MKIEKTGRSIHFQVVNCVMLLIMLFGQLVHVKAQQSAASAAPVKPEDESAQASSPKQPGLGIRVHGHWLLQLKNADGTLADQREFENSLVTSGANPTNGVTLLDSLLLGNAVPAGFALAFITGPASTAGIDASTFCLAPAGSTPISPTEQFAPTGIACYGFVSSLTSVATYEVFPNQLGIPVQAGLTTTLNGSGAIVLSGNYLIPSGMGTITAVQSYLGTCTTNYTSNTPATSASAVAPSQCNTAAINAGTVPSNTIENGGPLTSTTVSPLPLAVTPGQVLAVTFILSFS